MGQGICCRSEDLTSVPVAHLVGEVTIQTWACVGNQLHSVLQTCPFWLAAPQSPPSHGRGGSLTPWLEMFPLLICSSDATNRTYSPIPDAPPSPASQTAHLFSYSSPSTLVLCLLPRAIHEPTASPASARCQPCVLVKTSVSRALGPSPHSQCQWLELSHAMEMTCLSLTPTHDPQLTGRLYHRHLVHGPIPCCSKSFFML